MKIYALSNSNRRIFCTELFISVFQQMVEVENLSPYSNGVLRAGWNTE